MPEMPGEGKCTMQKQQSLSVKQNFPPQKALRLTWLPYRCQAYCLLGRFKISFTGKLRFHRYFSCHTMGSTVGKCGPAHYIFVHIMHCAASLVETGVLKKPFCCFYLQSLDMRYFNNRLVQMLKMVSFCTDITKHDTSHIFTRHPTVVNILLVS